jgi:hypothetical protein
VATFTDFKSALAAMRDSKNITRTARLLSDSLTAIIARLLPAGGTTGQVLEKNSNTDYDVGWHTITIPPSPAKGLVFGFAKSAGIPTGQLNGFVTVDYAGTISGWSLSANTGTITVRFWKKANGTAVPTVADNINTSGVSLSSGTHVRSTTVSDFTTTAVAVGDIFAVEITALTGTITNFSGTLEITPT